MDPAVSPLLLLGASVALILAGLVLGAYRTLRRFWAWLNKPQPPETDDEWDDRQW